MTSDAHIIVLGNEKGGSGKSTTAMHLCIALAQTGLGVGVMDLDLRQQSLFRYLENRDIHTLRTGKAMAMPEREPVETSTAALRANAEREDREAVGEAISRLSESCDVIVIDTPGALTAMSEAAHAAADTLITPINDSLIDFDLLGKVDPDSGEVIGPSIYSEMVWSARQRRAVAGQTPMDWIVLRNRMSTLDSRNRRKVGAAMEELSRRIGFRILPGFSERVIFRELFLNGLTLLDLEADSGINLTMSHVAARHEVRDTLKGLNLPHIGVPA